VTDTREFKPGQDNEKQFFSRKVEESLKKKAEVEKKRDRTMMKKGEDVE